jgi:hypothetical protein
MDLEGNAVRKEWARSVYMIFSLTRCCVKGKGNAWYILYIYIQRHPHTKIRKCGRSKSGA